MTGGHPQPPVAERITVGSTVGHYHVLARLGAGGMGVVYEAEDLRLQRHVALKFLPAALARDLASLGRFEREARLASSLNHPHICTVYDIGTLDHSPYIVLELLEGETLRHRIASGPLSLDEFLRSAPQIVSAVAAAHTRRIVHRDLKPANIFVTRTGIIKVLDFGLAKPMGEPDDQPTAVVSTETEPPHRDTDLLTHPGAILGTTAYMSPEQVSGYAADARSDVFALGVIFYEALTGRRPFEGSTTHELREQILTKTPLSLAAVVTGIPQQIDHLVSRCLHKRRAERFASAEDLEKTLAAVVERARQTPSIATVNDDASPRAWRSRRIEHAAVLPFAARGADADSEYLGDAIAEDLIRDLSAIPGLRIKARSVVQRYRQQQVSPAVIGKELGVDAVVLGAVSRHADRLSVSVEFVRCDDESLLWSDRITRGADDLPAIERDVLAPIVREIAGRLGGAVPELPSPMHQPRGDAHDLYLRGRACWNERTPSSLERAIRYFSLAVDTDPEYARAFSGLADAYTALAFYDQVPAADVMPRAKAAAQRAVERDPSLPEGHASLGLVSSIYDFNWDESGRRLRKALDLNASLAHVHHWYAMQLSTLGGFDEAYAEIKRALALDPLATAAQADALNILIRGRRYDEAAREARRVLAIDASWAAGWAALGRARQYGGHATDAVDAFERARSLNPSSVRLRALLASGYCLVHRGADAAAIRARLLDMAATQYVPPFWLALVAHALGETETTLRLLDQAVTERYPQVAYLAVDPAFDDLKTMPAFLTLLDRVHLAGVRANRVT